MPSLVSVPMVFGKAAMVVSPAPPKVMLRVVESLLAIPDVTVSRPESLLMRASPLKLTPPLRVLLPLRLRRAPPAPGPVPASVTRSARVMLPCTAKVAPLLTVVCWLEVPSAPVCAATNVPASMVTFPSRLLPLSVACPVPLLVRLPPDSLI